MVSIQSHELNFNRHLKLVKEALPKISEKISIIFQMCQIKPKILRNRYFVFFGQFRQNRDPAAGFLQKSSFFCRILFRNFFRACFFVRYTVCVRPHRFAFVHTVLRSSTPFCVRPHIALVKISFWFEILDRILGKICGTVKKLNAVFGLLFRSEREALPACIGTFPSGLRPSLCRP